MNNKDKVSTDSYKGVRDFYPKDWLFQKWLFWQMASSAELFGYENYAASPLEYTNLYTSKSGPEIVSECYNLIDKGGREVTLRPEMTPTLARMIAAQERELSKPIRWYSIPNVFRYEKPQRGRLREHYQFNADIFGVEGIEAEIELIEMGSKICHKMGLKTDDFVIKINNRKITSAIFYSLSMYNIEKYDIDCFEKINKRTYDFGKLFDKKNKISEEEFKESLQVFLDKKMTEIILLLFSITDVDKIKTRIDNIFKKIFNQLEKNHKPLSPDQVNVVQSNLFTELKKRFEKIENSFKCIKSIIEKLEKKGIKNVEFDLTLMRGFDYYTDTVFEFFDTHPENNRSMFGGGRYDDLLDIFGKDKISAVGFGMGDVTAKNSLEIRNLLPKLNSKTKISLLPLEKEFFETAENLAKLLRKNKINTEIDYSKKKLVKKINSVEKKEIEYFIAIGENEKKSENFSLKNIFTEKKWDNISQEKILEILEK